MWHGSEKCCGSWLPVFHRQQYSYRRHKQQYISIYHIYLQIIEQKCVLLVLWFHSYIDTFISSNRYIVRYFYTQYIATKAKYFHIQKQVKKQIFLYTAIVIKIDNFICCNSYIDRLYTVKAIKILLYPVIAIQIDTFVTCNTYINIHFYIKNTDIEYRQIILFLIIDKYSYIQ